jgi:hypothetical protein
MGWYGKMLAIKGGFTIKRKKVRLIQFSDQTVPSTLK